MTKTRFILSPDDIFLSPKGMTKSLGDDSYDVRKPWRNTSLIEIHLQWPGKVFQYEIEAQLRREGCEMNTCSWHRDRITKFITDRRHQVFNLFGGCGGSTLNSWAGNLLRDEAGYFQFDEESMSQAQRRSRGGGYDLRTIVKGEDIYKRIARAVNNGLWPYPFDETADSKVNGWLDMLKKFARRHDRNEEIGFERYFFSLRNALLRKERVQKKDHRPPKPKSRRPFVPSADLQRPIGGSPFFVTERVRESVLIELQRILGDPDSAREGLSITAYTIARVIDHIRRKHDA